MSEQKKTQEWTLYFDRYGHPVKVVPRGHKDDHKRQDDETAVPVREVLPASPGRQREIEIAARLPIVGALVCRRDFERGAEWADANPPPGESEVVGCVVAGLKKSIKAWASRAKEAEAELAAMTEERNNWKRNADARWEGLVAYEKELAALRNAGKGEQ